MSGVEAKGPGPKPEKAARRVQIRVPDSYRKVDDSVWEDLESYLYLGFLTSPAVVAENSYVFKTLNHQEVRNVVFFKPAKSSPPTARASFRAAFIAHSILYVDGQNALHDRPRHIAKLVKIISRIPAAIQERVIENLGALNARASRLYPLTEVYVHENRSRYHWLHVQSTPVHSPLCTGLAGTEELGMNYVQQTWTALNRLLDRRDEAERDWSNAKFIGSCFNGKGVRSVDEKDRSRREKDRSELEDRRMNVLFRYLNRVVGDDQDAPSRVELPDRRMATVEKRFRADSAEELAEQLSAALSGEKDHHDLVVEAQEKRLRERARMIDSHKRQIHMVPDVMPPPSADDYGPGVRILGGKKEADELLLRWESARREHHSQLNQQVRLDLSQDSDETPGGGS